MDRITEFVEAQKKLRELKYELRSMVWNILSEMRGMTVKEAYEKKLIRLNFSTEGIGKKQVDEALISSQPL